MHAVWYLKRQYLVLCILKEISNKFELKCLGPICTNRHCVSNALIKAKIGTPWLRSCITFKLFSLHINTKLSCQQNQQRFQTMPNAWPAYSSPHSPCKVVHLLKKEEEKKKKSSTWIYAPLSEGEKSHLLHAISYFDSPYNTGRTTAEACLKWGSTSIADECFSLVSRAVKGTEQNNLRSARNYKKHFSEELVCHYSNPLFFKEFTGRKKKKTKNTKTAKHASLQIPNI